jgi:hypothetical protein
MAFAEIMGNSDGRLTISDFSQAWAPQQRSLLPFPNPIAFALWHRFRINQEFKPEYAFAGFLFQIAQGEFEPESHWGNEQYFNADEERYAVIFDDRQEQRRIQISAPLAHA